MRTLLLLLAMLLFAPPVLAQAPPEAPRTVVPYVSINVGIEMHALERAAEDTARATEELARAVRDMASLPSLSPAQQAQLMAVLERVDGLSSRVAGAIDRLPAAVSESREPLAAIADDVAGQIRWTLFGALVLLVTLVLSVLGGFYMLVLRPSRVLVAGFTAGFHGMVRSLEQAVTLATAANAAQLARAMEALKGAPEARDTNADTRAP